jgi:hypothetical protein
MSFDLILPFLRPIEPLLLDESVSEIMGNPDATWWYERDGIIFREATIQFDSRRLHNQLIIRYYMEKRFGKSSSKLSYLPISNRALEPPHNFSMSTIRGDGDLAIMPIEVDGLVHFSTTLLAQSRRIDLRSVRLCPRSQCR